MNETQLLLLNLVTKVGIEAALSLLENVTKVTTINDAIVALKETQKISYKQLKQE
jgi:hypothetical protein